MTTRRQFAVQLTSLAALGTGTFSTAQAQQTPELARLLVGFPPGGSTDNVARRRHPDCRQRAQGRHARRQHATALAARSVQRLPAHLPKTPL